MKESRSFALRAPLFAFLFLFVSAIGARADTFIVTRSDDRNAACNSGTDCSLREAINAANASPTDDTINFNQNVATITLSNEIVIQNAGTLIINGRGANLLTINGNGQNNSNNQFGNRIFSINNAIVTITNVKLTGGYLSGPPNDGGAIRVSNGTLVLERVYVTNNYTNNGVGGGIAYLGGTNHRILNSTISSNTAFMGLGGGFISNAPLYVANTTISDNIARAGLLNGAGGFSGSPTLRNVTMVNNRGASRRNAYFGSPDIRNSIIVGVEQLDGPPICQLTGGADNLFVNTSQSCPVETFVGPLQDNGGPTPTHALAPGSPAIDAGNNALAVDPFNNLPLAADQRGFPRIIDGNNDGSAIVDIGAYEFANAAPPTNPANLLVNPGFEQGDAAWNDWGNSSVVQSNAASGNFALQIGTGAGGREQTVAALANTTYNLSAFGKVTAGETGWIITQYLDSVGNQVAPQSYIAFNNTTYEQKQIILQTPANVSQLRIWIWKNAGAGYFYTDDISLTKELNLLTNPSFEQGETGWENWGNSNVVASNAAGGNFALQTGTGAGGRSQTIAAQANTTYNLSNWGKVGAAGEAGWIVVNYLDSSGNQIGTQPFIAFNSTTYERKQIALLTPANTAQMRIWIWKNDGSSYFYADDFALRKE